MWSLDIYGTLVPTSLQEDVSLKLAVVVGLIDILTINESPWMEFIRNQTRNHLLLTVTSSPSSAIIVLASAPTNCTKRGNEPEISLNRPNKTPLVSLLSLTFTVAPDFQSVTHKKLVWVIVGIPQCFSTVWVQ